MYNICAISKRSPPLYSLHFTFILFLLTMRVYELDLLFTTAFQVRIVWIYKFVIYGIQVHIHTYAIYTNTYIYYLLACLCVCVYTHVIYLLFYVAVFLFRVRWHFYILQLFFYILLLLSVKFLHRSKIFDKVCLRQHGDIFIKNSSNLIIFQNQQKKFSVQSIFKTIFWNWKFSNAFVSQ